MNEATDDLKTETPLTDGGYQLGQSTTDKVALHGSTPTVQPASADQAAAPATAATNSSPYGYSEAQANAIVTLLNEIRSVLVEKGIMKGSA